MKQFLLSYTRNGSDMISTVNAKTAEQASAYFLSVKADAQIIDCREDSTNYTRRGVPSYTVPEGWTAETEEIWQPIEGAVNAPVGYHWENNGKSRFGGEYKHRLVKDEEPEEQKAEVEQPEEQKPDVEQPATVPAVRFYYNGIKVGENDQLIKVSYSTTASGDESISIYAKEYGTQLPRELFDVSNDTDIYTDYFCTDYAKVTPDHPLYIFVKYAAMKANAADAKKYIKYLEKRLNDSHVKTSGLFDYYTNELRQSKKTIADFESLKNPGQPANSDLLKIDSLKQERENARLAAEHEKELAAREKFLNERCNGRRFIESASAAFPLLPGDPVVTILWSESPKFCAWNDGELKLSVSAADIILKTFDIERRAEEGGYDKTKFLIEYTHPVTGEPSTYEGRYDLGDNDGGLFEHIRSVGEYYRRSPAYGVSESDASEIVRLACWLENKSASALTA